MTAQLRILVAAVAAAALLTPVASAGKAKNAVFKGEIVGIEPTFGPGDHEISVKVLDASKWGRGAEGRTVTFVADRETRIRVPDRDGDGEAELSDFQPNDGVQLIARTSGAEFGGKYYVKSVSHKY